jgi:hypothetical protein
MPETRHSEPMIGYCGFNCHLCAARSDDPAVRQRLVDGWRRYLGHTMYTAENVHCAGCREQGCHADTVCEARPCAEARGIDSCGACHEYPCEKVRHLSISDQQRLIRLLPRLADITEDDWNLCIRQFEGLPNIARSLAEAGRIPGWLAKRLAGSQRH